LAVAALLLTLLPAISRTRPQSSKTTEKPAAAKKKVSGPAKKTTSKASSRKAVTKPKAKKTPAYRSQQRPTPERYREIEEALASRGYLSDEPAGKWTAASVEALRNFQSDNELPATGRIDSLSLIQLGLGPKHNPTKQD